MTPSSPSSRRSWALFIAGLVLLAAAWGVSQRTGFDDPYVWWALAEVLILLSAPAFSVFVETSIYPLLYLGVAAWLPDAGLWLSFPLVVTTLSILAHPLSSRVAALLVVVGALPWADIPALAAAPSPSWVAYAFVAAGLLGLLLFVVATGRSGPPPKHIDLLLCSYSGNTAHFAQRFELGASRAGARITVHRFHHHRDFCAEFRGDALVVAYPVAGWNPFWPMLEYLLRALPRGDGKPAFLLYTSAGGPENGHVVPWLALSARGYRVLGRLGAMYPMNITLLRLFSSRLWRFFDALLPRSSDVRLVERMGEAFAAGRPAGLALTLFPFVLFVVGPLTYNRFINYIYRGYSIKRLCNGCERCIRFCPTERLYLKNGRVRSKGTCALCYGCVNLCPTDAMQLALVSELGNVYTPRFPKLVVKRKPTLDPRSGEGGDEPRRKRTAKPREPLDDDVS